MENRNYKLDNIRFLLIFCVVFGHLLELFPSAWGDILYRLIYTFHMPAFLFITGWFAKYNPKKILLHLVYPYILFQTLYLLFHAYWVDGTGSATLSYTTPYWLLWYLPVTIFCYLAVPFLQWKHTGGKIAVFLGSVAISLLAGKDRSVGYYLSLSRFLCFLPFFVGGFLAHGLWPVLRGKFGKAERLILLGGCLAILVLLESWILGSGGTFTRNVLYGSYSYAAANYDWIHRLLLHITAFAWIGVLFCVIPGGKLPFLSTIGKNTLPVFLFHGFVVRFLRRFSIFQYGQAGNLALAAVIAIGLLLLFGNPWSARVCKWGFTGHWIDALASRIRPKETT
jgi:fucose 4-O-acetylase-like acetyltransferase